MKKFKNILWGLVFIILGLVLAGNALGITDIDIFFDGWWTLLIIIPCFIGLFEEKEKGWYIAGLLLGVALFLSCRDLLDLSMLWSLLWKLLIPGILVAIGISMIFKNTIGGKIKTEINKINAKNGKQNEYWATFAGQDVRFDGETFRGIDLTTVFGGINCDLTNSIIEEDVVINAKCIFGGIDIFVPDNVKVKIKSIPIFGGVSNKSKYLEKENMHTIYVNATCIFGGIDIK